MHAAKLADEQADDRINFLFRIISPAGRGAGVLCCSGGGEA